jgi:hypothetical protein
MSSLVSLRSARRRHVEGDNPCGVTRLTNLITFCWAAALAHSRADVLIEADSKIDWSAHLDRNPALTLPPIAV